MVGITTSQNLRDNRMTKRMKSNQEQMGISSTEFGLLPVGHWFFNLSSLQTKGSELFRATLGEEGEVAPPNCTHHLCIDQINSIFTVKTL